MKLLTLNICAVSAAQKMSCIVNCIERLAPEIVFLQEVTTPRVCVAGYEEAVNVGEAGRGTAILWRRGVPLRDVRRLPSGRAVSARIGDVTIANVYAPAGSQGRKDRVDFFTHQLPLVLTDVGEQLILGGDFNAVLHKNDTTGTAHPCPVLRAVVERARLEDAWRRLRPDEAGYTCYSPLCASRLDRWYAGAAGPWTPRAISLHTVPVTDHVGVLLEICEASPPCQVGSPPDAGAPQPSGIAYPPGKSTLWKIDPALLRDERFRTRFADFWSKWREERGAREVTDWWEEGKVRVRALCAALARQFKEEEESLLNFYSDCLDELTAQRVPGAPADPRTEDVKQRITNLLARRLPGLSARSKAEHCDGEVPGMHQVAAGIRRRVTSRITSLQDGDGEVLTSQDDLLRHAQQHYQHVLGAPPADQHPVRQSILDEVVTTSVTTEDNEALLRPVTREELAEALRLSPRGRSPGEDGLTAEFYLVTWSVLGDDLLAVMNAMLERRRVAPSHKLGIMTLIPKATPVRTIGDLRPITLLNVDGKIFSRVVTRRLSALQDKLLHPMQVRGGGGAGSARNMHGALADLRDVVAAVDLADRQRGSRTAACIASVDFAGAFNNVRHSYMWAVLRRYGVSADVVSLVASMYQGAATRIKLNGSLTEAVRLGRGVRQGCPLSMILFNIVMSPLIKALNSKLVGLTLPGVIEGGAPLRLAASAYVDDATAILDNANEVETLSAVLEAYGAESGLRVNPAKSKMLPLGSWSRTTPGPYPYVDEVRILGVTFTRTVRGMMAANWPARLRALRGTLVDARLRVLNICQRVQYCNSYALSILWHTAQVLPLPTGILKDVRKALSAMLWAGEPLRVAFDVLCLPPGRGGLGLHDPTTRARAMFTSRWLTAQRASVRTLSGAWLDVLDTLYGDGEELPAPVQYFKVARDVRAAVQVPTDKVGKELTKSLVHSMTAASTAVPRVVRTRPDTNWAVVWRRVHSRLLPADARAAWYRAVHDIIPCKANLHRTNQADDPRCNTCGEADSVVHQLTACRPTTRVLWRWTARQAARLTGAASDAVTTSVLTDPDCDTPSKWAGEALAWLLGTMVEALLTTPGHDVGRVLRRVRKRRDEVLVTCPKKVADIINLFDVP